MGIRAAKDRRRGMTLIEVMMAVGVLAFSFSIVYGSLITLYTLGRVNEDRVLAVSAVSSLLEEIQAMDLTALADYSAPKVTMPGVDHWVTAEVVAAPESEGDEPKTFALPLKETSLSDLPNPAEVRVTLYWEDAEGRLYKFRASTMRSR